jgi:hypothetical protein
MPLTYCASISTNEVSNAHHVNTKRAEGAEEAVEFDLRLGVPVVRVRSAR